MPGCARMRGQADTARTKNARIAQKYLLEQLPTPRTGFVLTRVRECVFYIVLAAALAGEDPDVCGPEFELKDPARTNLTPRSRLEKTPQKHRATVTRGGPP